MVFKINSIYLYCIYILCVYVFLGYSLILLFSLRGAARLDNGPKLGQIAPDSLDALKY